MKYSNEIKVGVTIVITVVIFVFGVRYFEDIPLLKGQYELETAFDDASGLIGGSSVQINGVRVGAVERVRLDPETQKVHVWFDVDEGVVIPEGSYTKISGLSVLGSVNMVVKLGPQTNDAVPPGGFVPSLEEDFIGNLADRAPGLVNRADTFLVSANDLLLETNLLLADPDSDLRQTFVALRNASASLDRLLTATQPRLDRSLAGFETVAADVSAFTNTTSDSLSLAISNLNTTLARLNRSLDALDPTLAGLDTLMTRVNTSEGTLGLLLQDPGVYYRLDSLLVSLNSLITNFEENPKKYLQELELIDIF